MKTNIFLTIAIPAYNRPESLNRLLNSIDYDGDLQIEILIAEDKSEKRNQIIQVFDLFKNNCSKYSVRLILNETNLGYDLNLINLISNSAGKYVMFMGDDDIFIPNSLKKYLEKLYKNQNLGYILRGYERITSTGKKENFKYFPKDQIFPPGKNTLIKLFRKSVFISGFCFKRELILDYYKTKKLNGTLLYQLYLCSRIILENSSGYFDIELTQLNELKREKPEFGSSVSEMELYDPGEISIRNSINFLKAYHQLINILEQDTGLQLKSEILLDLSKYSYQILSIQRDRGIVAFTRYSYILFKDIKLGASIYFYIYFIALLLLGKRICDRTILLLKNNLKSTPQL